MKHITIFLFLLCFLACDKSESGHPDCIITKLDEWKSDYKDCPKSSVIKYYYLGNDVYVFAVGQCILDGGAIVWDATCQMYCFLGGFGNLTECDGQNFFDSAVELEVLWEEN